MKAKGIIYDSLTDEERAQHEKEFQHHAMAAEYIDAKLSEKGCTQCAARFSEIAGAKLHGRVFVSPFRRTLQTACELLKDHPEKERLTLIVDAGAMEHLGCKNAMLLHPAALSKFCSELTRQYGLKIDCSSFLQDFEDKEWWFFEMVPDLELRAEIFKIVHASKTTYDADSEKPDYDMQVF